MDITMFWNRLLTGQEERLTVEEALAIGMAGRGKMRKRRTKRKKNKGKIEQRETRKVTVNATGSYKGRMIMYDVLVIGAGPAGSTSC